MLPAILPLFPLAQVVLFPHTYLPLHVFEPRYRQLTADVLATHRHFILGVSQDPTLKDPLPQDAGCFPTATLACIVKAEPHEDGRWTLLVQGVQTLRMQGEIDGRPYRQARVENLPFHAAQPLPAAQETRLMETLARYGEHHGISSQVKELLGLGMGQEVLLNTLAMALDFAPVEKVFLLESSSLTEFGDRLEQLMTFTLSGRHLAGEDPGTLH